MSCADVPAVTGNEDVVGWVMATEIAPELPVMVTAAVTVWVGSAVAVAATVTLPP